MNCLFGCWETEGNVKRIKKLLVFFSRWYVLAHLNGKNVIF